MSDLPVNYLKHILDECNYIIDTTVDIEKSDFLENETLKRAIVRSLEIIGEASKNITVDFKIRWKEIEWKQIAGMRDKLIHDYIGVNYQIVWDVVKNKIPNLMINIKKVVEIEEKTNQ